MPSRNTDPMNRTAATPGTANLNSAMLSKDGGQDPIAMWAACKLMAMRDPEVAVFNSLADAWARKAEFYGK